MGHISLAQIQTSYKKRKVDSFYQFVGLIQIMGKIFADKHE